MPAGTVNDFFAGFFYGQTKEGLGVDTAIIVESNRERNRGKSNCGKGEIRTIKLKRKRIKDRR